MKIIYKQVKQSVPHCGECGERLSGNNSGIMPYWCSCGMWKANWEGPYDFKLVKKGKA